MMDKKKDNRMGMRPIEDTSCDIVKPLVFHSSNFSLIALRYGGGRVKLSFF